MRYRSGEGISTYEATHVGDDVGASVLATGEPVGVLLRRRRKQI